MLKASLLLIFIFFVTSVCFSETINFDGKSELRNFITTLPNLSSKIDPNREINSATICTTAANSEQKPVPFDEDNPPEGCEAYGNVYFFLNYDDEAKDALPKEELTKKLGFKESDSFINFIKNKDYDNAFYFFQLHFDEDVINQKDSSGNSVFHYLAEDCHNKKALELFEVMTDQKFPSIKYFENFTPLKIKLSVDEDAFISKCTQATQKQVYSKIVKDDFLNDKNKKRETVLSILKQQCTDTHLISSILQGVSENEATKIISKFNFNGFDFTDRDGNYLFKSIPLNSKVGQLLQDKFTEETTRLAVTGGESLLKFSKVLEPQQLLKKNPDGETLLEQIQKANLDAYNSASLKLSKKAITDLKLGQDTPELNLFITKGDFTTLIDQRVDLFQTIRSSPNSDLRKKLLNYFDLNISTDSTNNPFLKNFKYENEEMSAQDFKRITQNTCEIMKTYAYGFDCDYYVSDSIEKRAKYGVGGTIEITLINLIDKAKLSGQNATLFLLINQLAEVNPKLADEYLKATGLTDSILDQKSYADYSKFMLNKIKEGQLDCSSNRSLISKFLESYLFKFIPWTEESKTNPCLVSTSAGVESLHFLGVSKDTNSPILSAETFQQAKKREDDPIKESTIRVYQLLKKGDALPALSEAYELYGNLTDIKSKYPIKTVLNSTELKSFITTQDGITCQLACEGVFVANIALNAMNSLKTILTGRALGAIAGFAAEVYVPSIAPYVTVGTGTAFGVTKGLGDFTINTLDDYWNRGGYYTDCQVNVQMKKADDFAALVKQKKAIEKEAIAQNEILNKMLNQYEQIMYQLSTYPDEPKINSLRDQYQNQFNAVLKEMTKYNILYEQITKLQVSDAKEVEKLGSQFINVRQHFFQVLTDFNSQADRVTKEVNAAIKRRNDRREAMEERLSRDGGPGPKVPGSNSSPSGDDSDDGDNSSSGTNNNSTSNGNTGNTGPTIKLPSNWGQLN